MVTSSGLIKALAFLGRDSFFFFFFFPLYILSKITSKSQVKQARGLQPLRRMPSSPSDRLHRTAPGIHPGFPAPLGGRPLCSVPEPTWPGLGKPTRPHAAGADLSTSDWLGLGARVRPQAGCAVHFSPTQPSSRRLGARDSAALGQFKAASGAAMEGGGSRGEEGGTPASVAVCVPISCAHTLGLRSLPAYLQLSLQKTPLMVGSIFCRAVSQPGGRDPQGYRKLEKWILF